MTTSCEGALGCLLDVQQSDGGWAYSTNSSWTEPTSYSILALRSAGGMDQRIGRASEWLARRQRKDGGWSPGPAVERSTHVTSLAVLALTGMAGYETITERGVHWLLLQSGAETPMPSGIARLAVGTGHPQPVGWPWFPGAAAWVIPTSLAICALSLHKQGKYALEIGPRVDRARRFLLNHRCPDHGWNHGGLFRFEETPASYPETTGIALLALGARGCPELESIDIEPSLQCAEVHARNPKSSEGENWLRLGLMAHRRNPPASPVNHRDWTVNHAALRLITYSAEAGRNPFVDHV